MKKVVRTPEERFENLQDYSFKGNYVEVEKGLRLHYVDEGARDNPVILLLHGEPSWSYLYRKMIPILAGGFRVIAPDLIGFGKSDKWVDRNQYSFQRHIDWIKSFILNLDLQNITLFCQDWGGLIGLRIVTEVPERFSRIVASNTMLPTGEGPVPEAFLKWCEFSQKSPDFDIGKVINMGTITELSDEVITAYNAPFPSEEYKAGARIFPTLVPVTLDDPEALNNKKAWKELMKWDKPFLTIFGDGDTIMKGADKFFQKVIPGTKNQKHCYLNAGHFIQEEKGEELAKLVINFIHDTPSNG